MTEILADLATEDGVKQFWGSSEVARRQTVRRLNPVLAGAAFGTAVFVAAHEIAVPALKLSSNPLKEPIPEQIAEFVSHLIYGVGTALTYDGLKKLEQ